MSIPVEIPNRHPKRGFPHGIGLLVLEGAETLAAVRSGSARTAIAGSTSQQHTDRVVVGVGRDQIRTSIPVEIPNRYCVRGLPHVIERLRREGDRIRRQIGRDGPEGRRPTEAAHPRCQEQCRRQASCHACPVPVHLSSRTQLAQLLFTDTIFWLIIAPLSLYS